MKINETNILRPVRSVGVCYTKDAQALPFRMPAGFPGDVNRTHPCWIEPASLDVANPPTFTGQACVIDAGTHLLRTVLAGDGALTDIYGFLVRSFPMQQKSSTNYGAATIGNQGAPGIGKADVMRAGYIMATLNNFAAQPSAKGGRVNIWIAATIANHVQGGVEAAATGGSTIQLDIKSSFNGLPDSSGNVEVIYNA